MKVGSNIILQWLSHGDDSKHGFSLTLQNPKILTSILGNHYKYLCSLFLKTLEYWVKYFLHHYTESGAFN